MLSRVSVIPVSAGLGLAFLYFLTLQAPQVNLLYFWPIYQILKLISFSI